MTKPGQIDISKPNTFHGSPKKGPKPLTDEELKQSHCTHGPNGKCINCLGITKDTAKDVKYSCKHPPNQKCPNCESL